MAQSPTSEPCLDSPGVAIQDDATILAHHLARYELHLLTNRLSLNPQAMNWCGLKTVFDSLARCWKQACAMIEHIEQKEHRVHIVQPENAIALNARHAREIARLIKPVSPLTDYAHQSPLRSGYVECPLSSREGSSFTFCTRSHQCFERDSRHRQSQTNA